LNLKRSRPSLRRTVFRSTRLLIGKRWKEKAVSYERIKSQFRACFEMSKTWVVGNEGSTRGERHMSGGGIRKWSPQTPQLSRDRSIPFLFAPYQFPRQDPLKKRAPEYSVVDHRWVPPAPATTVFNTVPLVLCTTVTIGDANLKYTQNNKKKEIILQVVIDRWTTPTGIDGIPSPLL
jgi:hypothetical protein